jgi:hypothetical protein
MKAIIPDRMPQHDAGYPFACAEAFQQEVRRYLEDEVGQEENARAETEGGLRQAQILVHRQRCEADIDAIEIGDEVANDEKGHEAFRDLGEGADLCKIHVSSGPLEPVESGPWTPMSSWAQSSMTVM